MSLICHNFALLQVLESFIRRALAWEKEETLKGLNVAEEKNGVFFFHSKNEESHEVGILLEMEDRLPVQKLKTIAPSFEGFHLAIIKLEEVIIKQTQGGLISFSRV